LGRGRHPDMIIRLPIAWLHASVITAWPILIVDSPLTAEQLKRIMPHERVHLRQQRRWAIYGLGVGLLLWFALYLLALPVWRNPWRERWEREAMREGDGMPDFEIAWRLQRPPYYLWGINPTSRKERAQ
jgi:hypothetical protein